MMTGDAMHSSIPRRAATARLATLCFASVVLTAAAPVHAACPDDSVIGAYVEDYKARRPNSSLAALPLADAQCARKKLIAALAGEEGPVIGYRAAFSNDLVRSLLRLDQPVWGAMYGKSLYRSPAKVPFRYGAVTYWDVDLMVEVKDDGLADAKSSMEALRHLSAVIPFVGLKDNMSDEAETQEYFIANNAGFRSGVLGTRIPIAPTPKTLHMFSSLKVTTVEDGKVASISGSKGFLDGSPLNAAMWLARTLKENGIVLKKGDLLGLGSFAMGQSPRKDLRIEVTYAGLPGKPVIALQFD
jgi:2-keto-4-pentenoate hydratase